MSDKEYFRDMLDEAQAWAKEVGYSEDDVSEIIKSVRRRKRERKRDSEKFIQLFEL